MNTFFFRSERVAYLHEGSGPPIVFLHNGGTSHAIWRPLCSALSNRYRVFAIDLVGFGASDKPAGGYTLEDHAAMLGAFVDHHALTPVNLVGNCMGSAMALRFAMRRPDDVRSLLLINPLTEATFAHGNLRHVRSLPRRWHGAVARAMQVDLPLPLVTAMLRFQLGEQGRESGVHRTPELWACYRSPGQFASLLSLVGDLDSYGLLDRFSAPADFPPIATIWGTQNRVLSAKAGRDLNDALRPARSVTLTRAGHLPMLEAPEQVLTILQDFLTASGERETR